MNWIKVKNELPKWSGPYYCSDGINVFVCHYDVNCNYWHDGDLENLNETKVTHWMPYPKAPSS